MDATGATRCLARLCQLTSSEYLVSLWPVVLRIARLVHRFTSETASPKELIESVSSSGSSLQAAESVEASRRDSWPSENPVGGGAGWHHASDPWLEQV